MYRWLDQSKSPVIIGELMISKKGHSIIFDCYPFVSNFQTNHCDKTFYCYVSPLFFIPTYSYSGDYTDALGHLQIKSGQNNNGYVPYVDYSRDYSPPPSQLQRNYNTMNSTGNYSTQLGLANNTTITMSSPPTSQSSQQLQLNGQLPGGNLSLTRNRQQELRQDNGLPSIQSSMNSLPNVLLGKVFHLKHWPNALLIISHFHRSPSLTTKRSKSRSPF